MLAPIGIVEYRIPTSNSIPTTITAAPGGSFWFVESGANQVASMTPGGGFTAYKIPTAGSGAINIVPGPGGDLWVDEPSVGGAVGPGKVAEVNPATGSIAELTVPGFPSTQALASDQAGDIWFIGNNGNQIEGDNVISQSLLPTPVTIPTLNSDPTSMTLGPDGNLWFTENAANKIGEFNRTTSKITEYPLGGGRGPQTITTGPDGNLWFTESGSNQIGSLNPSTGAIKQYGVPTASSGPYGIVSGPDGNLWFTERTAGKIGEVSVAGFFTEYALPSKTSAPMGITVGQGPDQVNDLWFTESGTNKIGEYDFTPAPPASPPSVEPVYESVIPSDNSYPGDITVGSGNNIWFAESNANKIGEYFPGGGFTEFSVPTASSQPYGIVGGPDGNIWFTEFVGNKLGYVNPSTGVVKEVSIGGNPELTWITVGPDRNIWFVETLHNQIGRYSLSSGVLTEFPIPTAASNPGGLVTGPDGNLWFTEGNTNKVAKLSPTTGIITEYTIPTANSNPGQITVGPDGNLWFTEQAGGNLGKIIPSTGAISEVPVGGGSPDGVATGPGGYLWFTKTKANIVEGYNVFTGAYLSWPTPTAASAPTRMVVGPDQDLYFVENNANQIGRVAPTPTHFAITTEPPSTVAVGSTFGLAVTAEDDFGDVAPAYNGSVTLNVTNYPSGVTLGGNVSVTTVDGTATFSGLELRPVGGYTLTATGGVRSAITSGISVVAGTATHLVVTTEPPTSVVAGAPFGLNVTAEDAANDVVPLFTGAITLSLASGPTGGTLGGVTTVNALSGVATFSNLLLSTPGTGYLLNVSGGGLPVVATTGITVTSVPISESPTTTSASDPIAITAGPDGKLWFSEQATAKLGSIDPATHTVTEFGPLAAYSQAIVAGPDGNLWFTEETGGMVGTINPTTGVITQFSVTAASKGADLVGIVIGSDGNLWIADPTDHAIVSLNPTTHASAAYPLPGTDTPWAITAGPDGNLWFTDPGSNSLGVFALAAHKATEFPLPTSGAKPLAITAGPDGNLWFTESQTSRIGSINPKTDAIVEDRLLSNFAQPNGIVAGPDGNIWFTAQGISEVGKLDLSSSFISYDQGPTSPFLPDAITVGSDGNVWFADATGSVGTVTLPSVPSYHLVLTSQPFGNVAAGTSIGLTVTAEDGSGHVNASFNGPITVTLASNPSAATLGGVQVATAVNGVATFSGLVLNPVGTGYTLLVSGGGETPLTSNSFNIVAGPASQLVLTTALPSTVGTGAPFGMSLTVEDSAGNVVTGYSGTVTLTLASNPGNASLGGTLTANISNGVASFAGLTLNRPGHGYSFTAIVGGLPTDTIGPLNVATSAATVLIVTTQPPFNVAQGAPFVYQVSAEDGLGNVDPNFTGMVSVVLTIDLNGATLGGTVSLAAVGGVANFTGLSLNKTGIGFTLSASSFHVLGADSEAFNVTPVPSKLQFKFEPPDSVLAGAPFSLQVTAEDSSSDTALAFNGPITIQIGRSPVGGSILGGTATEYAVDSVAEFDDLTINNAGVGYTLTAQTTGLSPATSNVFNVNPVMPSQLVVTTQPGSNQTVRSPFGLTVTAEDLSGNVATSFTSDVSLIIDSQPGGASLGGIVTVPAINGVATFNDVTLDTLGMGYTLRPVGGGLLGGDTDPFNVAPEADQLVITTEPPSTVTSSSGFGLTVMAEDLTGNVATNFNGNVTLYLDANPSNEMLGGMVTVPAVNGVAVFSGLTLNQPGGGTTLEALSGGLVQGITSAIKVAPAGTQLVLTTKPPTSVTTAAPRSD